MASCVRVLLQYPIFPSPGSEKRGVDEELYLYFCVIKLPHMLAYKLLSRISHPLKIESICGPKSLTRV